MVCFEVAESGPHFHAVLRTVRKINAIRSAWKRAFPDLTGNGSHSIAVVRDLDKYHRYMCKGADANTYPEICGAYGLEYQSVDWQNEQHALYWEENAVLQRQRAVRPVYDVVLDACRNQHVLWHNKEAIAQLYIRELASRNKPINIFSVRSYVQLIQIKLCPTDSALEDLARSVAAS